MKLLIINDGFYPERIGGAEIQIMNIKLGLEYLGWNVELLDSRKGYRSCFIFARKYRPTIIYQRGRKSSTWLSYLISKQLDIPFAFSASMNIDFRYLKKCHGVLSDTDRIFAKKMYRLLLYLGEDVLSLLAVLNADIMISQNEEQNLLCSKKFKKSSTIIPNYHAINGGECNGSDVFRVVWIATMKKWKRPEKFIQLASMFRDMLKIEFVMAGNIVDDEYRLLCDFWREYPNVRIINDVDYEHSLTLINNANVFVNTSNGNEGFPNTFIMSWLSGVPVVSFGFNLNTPMREIGFVSCDDSIHKMRDEILREYLAWENKFSRKKDITNKARMEYSFDQTIGALHKLLVNYV
jgi:glycosyltransferase involved in cell wall biosynthesis